MHLLRIVTTHPVVVAMMEDAARKNQWASFRSRMADMGVYGRTLNEPFAVMLMMRSETDLLFPAMEIVQHIGDSGTPWSSTLNSMADYKRLGHHSVSWGFDRAGHKRMVKAGFNVEG